MAKTEKKAKALVPTVVTVEDADPQLVEDTVVWIRNKVAETVLKGRLAVGLHIFEKFFANDIDQLRLTRPNKGASFRALAARCAEDPQIRMSKSALHRLVSIAAVAKKLGAEAAYRQLAPSHQGALLPMRDPDEIEGLAKTVLSKKLSVTAVAALVEEKKKTPEGKPRGRPRKAAILKALEQSEKQTKHFTVSQINALDANQTKSALKAAEGLAERLTKLIDRLKEAEQK